MKCKTLSTINGKQRLPLGYNANILTLFFERQGTSNIGAKSSYNRNHKIISMYSFCEIPLRQSTYKKKKKLLRNRRGHKIIQSSNLVEYSACVPWFKIHFSVLQFLYVSKSFQYTCAT